MSDRDQSGGSWTLLTGHGRVLVEIGRDPGARIRDISAAAGLTERTVQAIVADLEAAGYITRTRTGRRVRYTVNHDSMFRHPAPRKDSVSARSSACSRRPRRTPPPHRGRMTVRWGGGRRYAGGSAGVLPRTRRRSICDSRNPSRPACDRRVTGPGEAAWFMYTRRRS